MCCRHLATKPETSTNRCGRIIMESQRLSLPQCSCITWLLIHWVKSCEAAVQLQNNKHDIPQISEEKNTDLSPSQPKPSAMISNHGALWQKNWKVFKKEFFIKFSFIFLLLLVWAAVTESQIHSSVFSWCCCYHGNLYPTKHYNRTWAVLSHDRRRQIIYVAANTKMSSDICGSLRQIFVSPADLEGWVWILELCCLQDFSSSGEIKL